MQTLRAFHTECTYMGSVFRDLQTSNVISSLSVYLRPSFFSHSSFPNVNIYFSQTRLKEQPSVFPSAQENERYVPAAAIYVLERVHKTYVYLKTVHVQDLLRRNR